MTARWRPIKELGDERRMIAVRKPNPRGRWSIDLAYWTKGGFYKTMESQLSAYDATHFFVIEDVPEPQRQCKNCGVFTEVGEPCRGCE